MLSPSVRLFFRRNSLTILTVLSVIASVVTGVLIREFHDSFQGTFTPRVLACVKFAGDLFLQMLRSLIIPLIATSLICAIGNMNAKLNKFIGGYGVLYYMLTTLLAIFLGVILAMVIRPGYRYVRETALVEETGQSARTNALENLLDLVRNMFPENPVQATMEQYKTVLIAPADPLLAEDFTQWVPKLQMEKTMNILGIVIMSVFVGVALSQINSQKKREQVNKKKPSNEGNEIENLSSVDTVTLKAIIERCDSREENALDREDEEEIDAAEKSLPAAPPPPEDMIFLRCVNEANEIFMKLVNWVICLSPIGIYFLILGKMLETNDLLKLLDSLSFYTMTVIGGILIHACIVLPTIYWVFTRQNPFVIIRGMSQALLLAFGTASSSATLPVTMKCLRQLGDRDENLRIDDRVINFIVPIGATINMDGTALYEAVAAIFISQLNNVEMTPLSILTIVLTATLGSVGAAGIPHAGLITLIIVLDTLGLPISDITVIITIDWLLDRVRTACNVLGDSFGCVIISKRVNFDELEDMD